jgi:hypothetical protein
MKTMQVMGLRNKGVCSLKAIHEVASKLCPKNFLCERDFFRMRSAKKENTIRHMREMANNPVNNPAKKANLDALRAAWAKTQQNTSNEI